MQSSSFLRVVFPAGIVLVTLVLAFQPANLRPFTNSIGMEMIPVEPGTFMMGSNGGRHYWTEGPAHEVTLKKPFHISQTEITLEQYREFQPDFEGSSAQAPFVAGVTWHQAAAFARWLSEKEGTTYRLPTEAEWEYVARGEGGSQGAQNMLSGVLEWVHDWFGEYPHGPQTDPIGPVSGSTRVVRGGPLDIDERNFLEIDFTRPESRQAMAPAFGWQDAGDDAGSMAEASSQGLIGVWHPDLNLSDPQESTVITRLNNNWSNDPRGGGRWAAVWRGFLEAPASTTITFSSDTESPFRLKLSGQMAIDGWETREMKPFSVEMKKGERIPMEVWFARWGSSRFSLYWEWEGQEREVVPESAISYTPEQARQARAEATTDVIPGQHAIGFRLVMADWPDTAPTTPHLPYNQAGVKQDRSMTAFGPDPSTPYFRKRYYLPTPLENSPPETIDALGLHPSFREHNHSPALEVLPNGDVLMVIYTSYAEYEPGVSLIASRLRFGSDEWDMPSTIADLVGVNDHAPLLWTDGDDVRLFWGSPKLGEGAFPFQWMSSSNNGASWGEIHFPRFVTDIGSHSRQPINSAFRDEAGRIYVASDGSGGESVLWASDDDGRTWRDTGGRSGGRHTTFAQISDGRILGMGGKNTHIEEYMPKSITSDGGQSYEVSKTPFSRLGTNQRPTLIRLESGRLFFAGDFVHLNSGAQPPGLNQTGSYVALSDDDGESWHIKKLVGAQPHERREVVDRMRGGTLGYAVARQAPNGIIHLIGTMTNPSLHFEMNEAWILEGDGSERSDGELMAPRATSIETVESFEERYPNGELKLQWYGGIADNDRFLLHGSEVWFYENGDQHREATYHLGRKVGVEKLWWKGGVLAWTWTYHEDGSNTWTQYHPNGEKRAESTWLNLHADGPARLWDEEGKLVSEVEFSRGEAVE